MDAWCEILLDHCAKNRIFVLNVGECLKQTPFRNDSISRSLTEESLITILKEMEKRNRIDWIKTDSEYSSCLVYWLKVEEWAEMVMRWVEAKAMNNTICTFYEIIGDDASSDDLRGLDERILVKAIGCLEQDGKAVLMEMDNSYGVKFL